MCVIWRRGNDSKICEDLNTYSFPTEEKEINRVLGLVFEELVQTYTIYVAVLECSVYPCLSDMIYQV